MTGSRTSLPPSETCIGNSPEEPPPYEPLRSAASILRSTPDSGSGIKTVPMVRLPPPPLISRNCGLPLVNVVTAVLALKSPISRSSWRPCRLFRPTRIS